MCATFKMLLAAAICLLACGAARAQEPVQVFILAGQSNMEGKGQVETGVNGVIGAIGSLRYQVNTDPANYGHLGDGGGNWNTRTDVFVHSTTDGGEGGGLTVGYGSGSMIGPELGFGSVVGNAYSENVLIIKTAWGGQSLAVDFLSPTAAAKRGRDVGEAYNDMLSEVSSVLGNIGAHVPGYAGQGYELKGFGWHQGWNDRVNGVFVSEYEENMVDFINDVRFDLGASDLPFVVANTGIGGTGITGDALTLAEAQLAVADPVKYPDFAGNVKAVDTRPFWRDASVSPANSGYHWNLNAETFYLMGDAMGDEMATMVGYVQFERAYLTVDLQTGEIKIVNPDTNLEDMDLEAYSITSASGALDTAGWTSITGNYDGDGDTSVDSDNWTVDTATTGELGESALPGGADGLVAIGEEVSLGVGAWIGALTKSDLAATYTDTEGNVINLNIRYLGTDNILADLNTDGSINVDDWAIFVQNGHLDMSSLSEAQAYRLGDLDGDMDNDLDDFDLFRKAYELEHPEAGAFAAMLAQYAVPEPSSLVLLAGAAGLCLRRRRRRQTPQQGNTHMPKPKRRRNQRLACYRFPGFVAAVVFLALTGAAGAQELFSVNIWSVGKTSGSVWSDPVNGADNIATLTLENGETAGIWETSAWQNIDLGNPFSTSTPITTITGSSGATAIFSMPDRRNSSPYDWNGVRDDSDATHVGNATLLDAHATGTEDPYDESNNAIIQVTDIPFPVYDVVIYLGINAGQKYQGKGAIDFEGSVQQFTMPTSEPDGTLTRIVDSVTPGNYILYEEVTASSFTAEIRGDAFTHLGPAGFQIREVLDPTELKLQVNTVTGETTILGDNTSPCDINYYQITSAGNSLDPEDWNSLQDQDDDASGFPAGDGTGNGWEEVGGAGPHAIAEGFLLGDSAFAAGESISLGNAYNRDIDAQDLLFSYRTDAGQRREGVVEYIDTVLADTNGDGVIDAADYITVKTHMGMDTGAGPTDGDFNLDGAVDWNDLQTLINGMNAGAGSDTIPEPMSLLITLAAALPALWKRRRNRS